MSYVTVELKTLVDLPRISIFSESLFTSSCSFSNFKKDSSFFQKSNLTYSGRFNMGQLGAVAPPSTS